MNRRRVVGDTVIDQISRLGLSRDAVAESGPTSTRDVAEEELLGHVDLGGAAGIVGEQVGDLESEGAVRLRNASSFAAPQVRGLGVGDCAILIYLS